METYIELDVTSMTMDESRTHHGLGSMEGQKLRQV